MTVKLHESALASGREDVWARLAAPLPKEAISWRMASKPKQRDGKYFARFVSYVEAGTVRERLDSVVPGEWHLHLEPLPPAIPADSDGVFNETPYAFKARLTILGITREDVGVGKDYKQASTDAFKRVAVRFGVAHELYDMHMLYVEVDGDGKYAKPREDPQACYDRKYGSGFQKASSNTSATSSPTPTTSGGGDGQPSFPTMEVPACPKCGGKMWDNRLGKRNPKAPNFKCRDRSCDGVIWPSRDKKLPTDVREPSELGYIPGLDDDGPDPSDEEADDVPF